MNSFISSIAACTLLVAISAAAPTHAEDMKKSDILPAETKNADMMTTAGTKADCMHKAEMEQDSVKKEEILKACDAMQ